MPGTAKKQPLPLRSEMGHRSQKTCPARNRLCATDDTTKYVALRWKVVYVLPVVGCRDFDITEIDITESDVTETDITENDITESDITESDIT